MQSQISPEIAVEDEVDFLSDTFRLERPRILQCRFVPDAKDCSEPRERDLTDCCDSTLAPYFPSWSDCQIPFSDFLAKVETQPNFLVTPASGQFLQQLESFSQQLALLSQCRLASISTLYRIIGETSSPACEAFDRYNSYLEKRAVRYSQLSGALLKSLQRRVRRLIHQIKQSFFAPKPRFCSLDFSRRDWFLLHGSHPPKAAASLSA